MRGKAQRLSEALRGDGAEAALGAPRWKTCLQKMIPPVLVWEQSKGGVALVFDVPRGVSPSVCNKVK